MSYMLYLFIVAFSMLTSDVGYGADDSEIEYWCEQNDCRDVVANAEEVREVDGRDYQELYDNTGQLIGWIGLSTDLVNIKAYSSKPMITLVAIDLDGEILGAKVVHHTEPILLVGIPESTLTRFVSNYAGIHGTERVTVGRSSEENVRTVDAISGATVTCLAQNRTILESARKLGLLTGAISRVAASPGHFIDTHEIWNWTQLIENNVFGFLHVSEAQLGVDNSENSFIDLWFTIADARHVGLGLMSQSEYQHLMSQLSSGEHLVVVLGSGSSSFKGSGFVRGGIFDRVRIEQGLNTVTFRDSDYFNLDSLSSRDAPKFKEGAVFIARGGKLDPGLPFDFVFLGSRYASLSEGGFERSFHSFKSTHRLPKSVYVKDKIDRPLWELSWKNSLLRVVVLCLFLACIGLLFLQRTWLVAKRRRLRILHILSMTASALVLGFFMKAQPSVTQILTLLGSIVGDWEFSLFLSEPFLFVFWLFVAVTIIIWGRGVFCGWLCPYGSLSELLRIVARKLGVKEYVLPTRIHEVLGNLRYVILLILVSSYFYSPELAEVLAEVEPFKTTFYVRPWAREALFVTWWLFLLVAALFVFRPFCQYLCPLGAALAIPSTFRLSGPVRRSFCSKCKICPRTCEPRAIKDSGVIDPRKCLNCMECELNAFDKTVCPPLVSLEKMRGQPMTEQGVEKKNRLLKHAKILD